MCGIAGTAGSFSDGTIVQAMLEIMKHRGPDAQGFFVSEGICLGHCRLAINDLSPAGNQPFVSNDRNIAVVVNGEIYNADELKKPLELKGYKFKSKSDSEIIFHAYAENGLDFVRHLNGMFAIGIWDGRKKELYLIRDRLGIKPLYYHHKGGRFFFASEIKALAISPDIALSTDYQSLAEYLAFENYFSNRTLNEYIKMVEPGEIVSFNHHHGGISREYFWNAGEHTAGIKKYSGSVYENYMEIIESSVNRHLLSDVPLGCYLSSGIDSSSVTYRSSRKLGKNLKTFTGSFGMDGFYDESASAAKIAEHFGCGNSNIKITPADFIEKIEKILWHIDEPKVGMGVFSQYMVAEKASKEVKVILTGHGGDEFFAGYPVFKAIYGKKNILKLIFNSSPRELMFAVYFNLYPMIRKEIDYFMPNIFPIKSFGKLLKNDFYEMLIKKSDVLAEPERLKEKIRDDYSRLTQTYLKFYLPSLFVVEDKISMAFSLESRTPLCDNEMLDFAMSLPLSDKLKGYELKHIPRTAMKGKLPDFIYNLPKRGFPTPLRYWFKNELRQFIREFINDNIETAGIFNKQEVDSIIIKQGNTSPSSPFDEIRARKIWIIFNLIHYFKNQKKRYR